MPINYREVAEEFKPEVIKNLIIGECPPSNGESYFYIPATINYITSMPGTIFAHYFQCIPTNVNKYKDMLYVLKELGVFLVDILDDPITIKEDGRLIQENVEILKQGITDFQKHLAEISIDVNETHWTFVIPTGRNYTQLLHKTYGKADVKSWPEFRRDLANDISWPDFKLGTESA